MLKMLCVGDLHFGKLNTLFGDKGDKYIAKSFDLTLQYAWDNGIEHIVQLGDVSDKPTLSYSAHVLLLNVLKKWDGKLNIYIILGNHDFQENGVQSLLLLQTLEDFNFFSTVKIIKSRELINIDGIYCNFLSYPHIEPLPVKNNKSSIVFAHFEVAGATADNGRLLKHGQGEFKDNHKYIMGHLHTPHGAYVGTLSQMSFGEKLPKSFSIITAKYKNGDLIFKQDRIKVDPLYRLRKLIIETKDDFKRLEYKENYLYKLFIHQDINLPSTLLQDYSNIIECKNWETKIELNLLQDDISIVLNDNVPIIEEEKELEIFLKNKGLTEDKIIKTLSYRNKLLSSL